MIVVLNYGLGNVQAFVKVYERLNIKCRQASRKEDLDSDSKIILPGVGSFDYAMERLNDSGMRETLDHLILEEGANCLGVCVGMQMMAGRSEEGQLNGLGWIEGQVKKFVNDNNPDPCLIPHMGWNTVIPTGSKLFKGLRRPQFYFLHSYHFTPKKQSAIIATTDYGGSFISAICEKNIYGVQFHPEKSHHWGERILKNFAEA